MQVSNHTIANMSEQLEKEFGRHGAPGRTPFDEKAPAFYVSQILRKKARLARLVHLLSLFCLLLTLAGCSAYSRQMRQARKYTKQNVKRQEKKSLTEDTAGPGEVSRKNVNYKDLDKIRHRCIYIKKNGERCGRKGSKKNGYKYCFWHTPESKY
jgi:hypothetical protein